MAQRVVVLDGVEGDGVPAQDDVSGEKAAVFEPVHGSAPKYAGQDKANPTALILSAALMLRHIGETDVADVVERSVREVIAEGETVTADLGGRAGTREFAEAVAARVRASV